LKADFLSLKSAKYAFTDMLSEDKKITHAKQESKKLILLGVCYL